MLKKFEKPILVEPELQVRAHAGRWGVWMEILLFYIGLVGYLLCNTTALGMSISPVLVGLLGAAVFAGMIFIVWYKRVFFGVLGGVAALALIAFPLTIRMGRYIGRSVSIFLNYVIYLLGSQEGYSGYLDQMTLDLEPYLKNESLLNRYLVSTLVLLSLVAAVFFALALFKRIPVMLAYIVPAIGLVPLFFYGIVPHYLAFSLFLCSLIGCYGQSLVQQMSRANKRKTKRLARAHFRTKKKNKEKKIREQKPALTTEQRLSFASANGQFGIVVALSMLVVTIATAWMVYSRPILQMDTFREKLDQVSTKVMNVVFRNAYEKQLNVAGEMGETKTIGLLMPSWRGLNVAQVSSHTDQPIYLRYRTTAALNAEGWQIPDENMLRNYNNAVDFDFYEYTQYYDFLCLTLPGGDPLEMAVDNYFSEDDGYLTDQITVFPQYKGSDLLGLPKGNTTKVPISEYSDLEREGDTLLHYNDTPSDREYSFRVVSPTLSSGVFLAKFDSIWSSYLSIRDEHANTNPYMVREQEYSNFVNAYYTQNPEEIKAVIGNKAWEIAGNYESRLAKVQSIERYLRKTYTYKAERKRIVRADGTPGDAFDYLEYFLNQNEDMTGYCTLFASSMTVMLRDMGIPARVVTGYYAKPEWTDVEYYTAKLVDSNYHAWVEVYFDGFGWVIFDPTPGFGEKKNYYLLEVTDGTTEEVYETEAEVEYVPPDNYVKYSNVLPEPTIKEEEPDLSDRIIDALNLDQENLVLKTVIRVILWVMLIALLIFAVWFFHHWQLKRALRGRPAEGVAAAYKMVLRLMQMRGFKFFEGETLSEFATRADNLALAPLLLAKVVPIFEKSLYSEVLISEKERQAAAKYLFALDKSLMRRAGPFKGLWYRLTLWVRPKHKSMIWHFK